MMRNKTWEQGAGISCLHWFALALSPAVLTFHAGAQPQEFRGEILVADHGCISCHDAADAVKERLASRAAPALGANGVALTPQWIRAYLEDPQKVKPGSLQPDLLGGLPEREKPEAVEALVHYLVSLNPGAGTSSDAGPEEIAMGRGLYHKAGCVACHAPVEPPPKAVVDDRTRAELAQLAAVSVPLGDLAGKTTVDELTEFLADPLKARPSGRMPSMKLSRAEAHAVAAYLLRDQLPADVMRSAGLKYEFFDAPLAGPADFDKRAPKAAGMASKINLEKRQKNAQFALRFKGSLSIVREGEYTFYATADDGVWLFVDGKLVVDNGGIHPAREKDGRIVLSKGEHAFQLCYFDGGGQIELGAAWEGPGLPKQEIPASAFTHGEGAMKPLGAAPFALDPAKVARGKEYFASLNCAACHQAGTPGTKSSKALAGLDLNRADGCLAEKPSAGLPRFALAAADREAMKQALAKSADLAKPLPAEKAVERAMAALNCYACHNRDQQGGPQGLRREYFVTSTELDLGDEGRLPPHLSGVGAKLKQSWLTNVIYHGATVRPYMATRMPAFGEAATRTLPQAFVKADLGRFAGKAKPPSDASASNGRKLVGAGGLSCIICHNFNGRASLGIPTIDLATTGDRLRYEWFHDYLLNPQSLRPGTRMPGFWPEGKAANKAVHGGDPEKQIGSIWTYISRPKGQRLPEGMITDKQELIADTEAVLYRNFIEGCGPRGIGVGYPEKANLAFDADFMSLALLWQGSFMDASRHRSGRGAGNEPPMGENVVKWTPGSPFAVLAGDDAPWPAETWRSQDCRFKGYTLDERRRPTFLYSFRNEVAVSDHPAAVERPGAPAGLRRTITLEAQKPVENLYFRAALARKIEPRGDGVYVVDETVTVRLTGGEPKIRPAGDLAELLVPVVFSKSKAVLTEELSW